MLPIKQPVSSSVFFYFQVCTDADPSQARQLPKMQFHSSKISVLEIRMKDGIYEIFFERQQFERLQSQEMLQMMYTINSTI